MWLIYFKTRYKPNKTLSAGCGPPANDLFGLIMKHFNVAYGNPSDEFIATPWNRFILIPELSIGFLLSVRPCAGAQATVEAKTDNPRKAHTLQGF